MTTSFVIESAPRTSRSVRWSGLFLVAAGMLWAAPVLFGLATKVWTTEQGAQGPIILVTGLWLLLTRLKQFAALRAPSSLTVTVVALTPCLLTYFVARMVNMMSGALLATWAAMIVILYAAHGEKVLRQLAFPLLYLLFLIPPPVFLVGPVVQLLKQAVSTQAVGIVSFLGIEAATRGSSLFVDQYQLLVEAACSGMNSLFSLAAVSVFYVHVRHHGDDWRYALLLGLAIIPIALGTNLVRVVLLLCAVHMWGVRVLDTPLHAAAGLAMAAFALVLLGGIDLILAAMAHRLISVRHGRG